MQTFLDHAKLQTQYCTLLCYLVTFLLGNKTDPASTYTHSPQTPCTYAHPYTLLHRHTHRHILGNREEKMCKPDDLRLSCDTLACACLNWSCASCSLDLRLCVSRWLDSNAILMSPGSMLLRSRSG